MKDGEGGFVMIRGRGDTTSSPMRKLRGATVFRLLAARARHCDFRSSAPGGQPSVAGRHARPWTDLAHGSATLLPIAPPVAIVLARNVSIEQHNRPKSLDFSEFQHMAR